MKRLLILLFSLLFVSFIACDSGSDDDESSSPTAPTETTEETGTEGGGEGAEEEAPPAEDPAPAGILLDQGVDSATEGVANLVATITVPGPGTVTATVVWEGDPAELVIYFKHGGPTNHGWAQGGSPLSSSFPVAAADAGGGWNFYIANTPGPTTNVAWEVRFIAD